MILGSLTILMQGLLFFWIEYILKNNIYFVEEPYQCTSCNCVNKVFSFCVTIYFILVDFITLMFIFVNRANKPYLLFLFWLWKDLC